MVDKYINDKNEVAVLYSPHYGSGWYTWAHDNSTDMLFDPKIVVWVLKGKPEQERVEIEDYVTTKYSDAYVGSNLDDLDVRWVEEGVRFRVHEYDGAESIVLQSEEEWILA